MAILCFNRQLIEDIAVESGVPQGSPLSSILFILYIASLYKALKKEYSIVSIIGFADDTNLLAFGRNTEACTS